MKEAGGGSGSVSGSDDGTLRNQLQYALGYLAVVAGGATLTDIAGVFFLVASVFLFPPVQAAIESRLGRLTGVRPTAPRSGSSFSYSIRLGPRGFSLDSGTSTILKSNTTLRRRSTISRIKRDTPRH